MTITRNRRAQLCLPAVPAPVAKLESDMSFADEVARRSYRHANGFAKLVLRCGDRRVPHLRLHVWTTADGAAPLSLADVNIHDHRWTFRSTVLCGALRVDEFEEVAAANGRDVVPCNKFVYRPHPGGGGRRLEAADADVHLLHSKESRTYGATEMHVGHLRTLHTVTPLVPALTATYLVQGPVEVSSACVYRRRWHDAPEDPRVAIEPEEVVGMARSIVSAVRRRKV